MLFPRRLSLLLALLAAFAVARGWAMWEGPPRDADGWSILKPSPDSHILYVSASGGDDALGCVYTHGEEAIGPDPRHPNRSPAAFRTIAAAIAKSRAGMPDWILLRTGDTWLESLAIRNGRSPEEPFVVASWGDAPERPMLKTGAKPGLEAMRGGENVAVVGIAFYAHTRDPASPDYASGEGRTGIYFYGSKKGDVRHVLVEDCLVRFYRVNVIVQGRDAEERDVVLRRNVIADAYSEISHSSGMYAHGVSGILFEENVMDHNGWLVQGDGRNTKEGGGATMFNHNTYLGQCDDVTFRGNMFLRGSSIGNKWRADKPGDSTGIRMEDNLYAEGEVGISIGGNEEGAARFTDVEITNNVLLSIGRTHPTHRSLAWYLDVQGCKNARIAGNLFLHQRDRMIGNAFAIHISKAKRAATHHNDGIVVRDNTVYGLFSKSAAMIFDRGSGVVSVTGNTIQLPGLETRLYQAEAPGEGSGLALCDNRLYTDASSRTVARVGHSDLSLDGWFGASGETGSVFGRVAYRDPERDLAQASAHAGGEGTFADFVKQARAQSRATWRPEYTARSVNAWLREGFAEAATSR